MTGDEGEVPTEGAGQNVESRKRVGVGVGCGEHVVEGKA